VGGTQPTMVLLWVVLSLWC